ncbi:low temperature requirement protein A [Nocardia sp. CDC159]|uniref:Low temperature requirement protein A n=1 Tax=Nocardia pulmonis TaxID=2951408 RepID=A0A9X2IUZ1_9NOCA|nr:MULTISPECIES: low temperature requirement protein A [Nocardia]MCM6772673.1 low temperature requirement protein A [Nocardia pulmonis]MCM6786024.1 low temperature requirement protein A [Nocardia sp. CDC159]
MTGGRRTRLQAVSENASVTQLELFFDLVLVFAFTQVTDLAAHETTAANMLRAFLVLAVMWWVWIAYAWLGNVIKADEGIARVALFGAMGAALIVALAIPEAFHDLPGGWYAPLVFALGYLAIRLIHLYVFWCASSEDAQLRRQVTRWSLGSITIGTVLLIIAATSHGTAQIALWIAAIVGDMVWTLFSGNEWRLGSVGHFAERHGLIVIVALGESIVSIGVGVSGLPISWPITVGALLALGVSTLLWWAYFDVGAAVVERAMAAAQGERRVQIARNCYTYWHFPMIVGVIALSLGLKKVLNYVGGGAGHTLRDQLHGIPLFALYGGVVVYLIALVGFRHYATRVVLWPRVLTAGLLIALIPAASRLPAMAALGLLFAVLAVLIGWEVVRYARPREEIRHGAAH